MRPSTYGTALGVVAIPVPVAIPTMLMVANDDVLTIANNNLR